MISLVLSKRGHESRIAANGREAVDLWEREPFDLILMDLQMPVMEGIEATRIIRGKEKLSRRHIPIFALTAHALTSFREQCAREGMDGYLTKPLRLAELDAAIESASLAALPG